jgi:hypothetical protein
MDNLPNISFVGRSISRREDQRLLTGRRHWRPDERRAKAGVL